MDINDEHDVSIDTAAAMKNDLQCSGDTDGEDEATEMADIVIRQNQIINRALTPNSIAHASHERQSNGRQKRRCAKDLLDPKKLLEQLRECETKQFKNAIDLLEQCEERHRRNEKKLSRLTIAASAGGALVGQEAVKEVGEITGMIEQVVSAMLVPSGRCRIGSWL